MKKSKQKAVISLYKKGWKASEIGYTLQISENKVKEIIKEYNQ